MLDRDGTIPNSDVKGGVDRESIVLSSVNMSDNSQWQERDRACSLTFTVQHH